MLTTIQCCLARTDPSRPIGGDHFTSEYRLVEEDMEGDLDMTVREDELNEKGRPLFDWVKPVAWLLQNAELYQEWEEDEEDEDGDFINLYESADEVGNGSEDSDKVYGAEEIVEYDDKDGEGEVDDVEREQEDVEGWEEGDDDVHMTDEGETSGSGLGNSMRNLGRPDSASSSRALGGDGAEHRFGASTQEIGELLLGRAMTPRHFFTSPEDQQDSIENIVTPRKGLLAGNACLILISRQPLGKTLQNEGLKLR